MRNDYLHAAVYATIGLAQARAHTNDGQAEATTGEHFERLFAAAIWHLHHDDHGWTTGEIAARVMTSLRNQGWTDDQITEAGISEDAVRHIVGHPEPPQATASL